MKISFDDEINWREKQLNTSYFM